MGNRKERRIAKTKKEQTTKKQPKQVSIFTVLFVLLIIAAFVGVYFGIRALIITLKYKTYTDKMYTYGYNELYENNKATATQKLTNTDMIRVILGSLTNTKEIANAYYLADENASDSINWYNYSKYLGVNTLVSEKELDSRASKIHSVILLVKMMEGFLDVETEISELKMSEAVLKEFTQEEQTAISKAVTLGLIKNKTSAIKQNDMLKGELNKLVIETVEKYATMHYDNNESINVVTKKSEMPDNYKEYPYIVDSIDKEIYELEYEVMTASNFANPKEVYKQLGDLYGQTNDIMTKHFEYLLNIDYETITVRDFLKNVNKYSSYLLKEEDVEEYVEYVKANKIKLEGSAKPLLPIIYNNGDQHQVRTEITFKVISSDTEYNLLFGDEENKVKYNSKEITMYVDVPVGMTLNSRTLLVDTTCFAEYISNDTTLVVVEE